jgi:hypothetical protein
MPSKFSQLFSFTKTQKSVDASSVHTAASSDSSSTHYSTQKKDPTQTGGVGRMDEKAFARSNNLAYARILVS